MLMASVGANAAEGLVNYEFLGTRFKFTTPFPPMVYSSPGADCERIKLHASTPLNAGDALYPEDVLTLTGEPIVCGGESYYSVRPYDAAASSNLLINAKYITNADEYTNLADSRRLNRFSTVVVPCLTGLSKNSINVHFEWTLDEYGTANLRLEGVNGNRKTIKYIKIAYNFKNAVGDRVLPYNKNATLVGPFEQFEIIGQSKGFDTYGVYTADTIDVKSITFIFMDGTSVKDTHKGVTSTSLCLLDVLGDTLRK